MLDLLNEMRAQHGLPAFRLNQSLSGMSWFHSKIMMERNLLFHTENLSELVQPFGATTWGENIAYARTLERTLQLWMASPSHRVHLLDGRFRWVGIGIVHAGGWSWVTLDLHD
jgi:uncharacterized protein YkwD